MFSIVGLTLAKLSFTLLGYKQPDINHVLNLICHSSKIQ
jgi:hypothetical protein